MPEADAAVVRMRAIVRGRVQRVAFRAHTREAALAAGVDGWVRNLPDGAVEAVFEGPADAVARALEAFRTGPRWARVDECTSQPEAPEGLRGFEIRA